MDWAAAGCTIGEVLGMGGHALVPHTHHGGSSQ